ncbi:hypothetical protein E1A91_D03G056100v1 [Gossypium mustelinum]|uniref:DUF4371 domain-containing protein n=1 Tax=Gossypium mustelinum TaxID=34275 RepID=A0A5D2VJ52_GOSMU|nr:hypothetical protein E1A91_D03G056100v1 [Gossypium mustelinum]
MSIQLICVMKVEELILSNPSNHFGSTTFTHSGFSNWKKVHNGCNCVFLTRYAFGGYDESSGSKYRGNFLEFLSLLSSYDEKVKDVLKSAPQNASYTSSTIQKEILQIYTSRVCNVIHKEIGDKKLCIIVDEARDEFVYKQILVKERFFDIVDIKDTATLTLKYEIFNVLLQHNLELALIATTREVVEVHQFFKDLSDIVSIVFASSKQHDELQKTQAAEITRLVSINELATRIGMNQIGTLQHLGETRWSSHLNSITILLTMYNATSTILENLKNIAPNHSQRGDAHNTYNRLRSFEFIFILHMIKEVLGVTDNLCQALQRRSQDILNVMSLVSTTKDLIQKLRDDGWDELLKNVISFCETWELDFPYMNAQYIMDRSHNKKEDVTFFKLFDIDKICSLVKRMSRYELKHYELDVCKHPDLRKISTLSELCRSLVESGKSIMYPLFDRLICPILTFLVSTASAKRVFSAMKIVKTRFCSKMKDDFLRSYLVVYTEKEIAENFNVNKIINGFSEIKDWKVQFKYIL